MNWLWRGTCWAFGDHVAVDGDMEPLEFAMTRETRLEILRPHFMTGIDPEFPNKVKAGDIIVAGRRFAQGNPHIQGFLGAKAHGVALVVESTPRGSFRNAINAGVPILPRCAGVTKEASTGEELEVDFSTGRFRNLTRGTEKSYDPISPALLETIALGGWRPAVERRIQAMRADGLIA